MCDSWLPLEDQSRCAFHIAKSHSAGIQRSEKVGIYVEQPALKAAVARKLLHPKCLQ